VLLLGGLLLSVLAGLMNEEFGRASKTPGGRLGATMALSGVVAIWGIRDHEHRRALHTLEARQYLGCRSGPCFSFSSLVGIRISGRALWKRRDLSLLCE